MWKPIADWPYDVSDHGGVRRTGSAFTLTPMRCGKKRKQYNVVRLCSAGLWEDHKVAELVLTTFDKPRPPGLVVRHLDDDDTNDCLTNLVWGTYADNANDRRHNTPILLTPAQALIIRARRAAGETGAALAREFSVSQQTVCDIHKGRIHTGA